MKIKPMGNQEDCKNNVFDNIKPETISFRKNIFKKYMSYT